MQRACLAAILAAILNSSLYAETATDAAIESLTSAKVQECGTYAELYLRMTDLRDLGADESIAVNRGVEFLGGVGRTGSHLSGKNYRPSVTRFARFIYANKALKRESLYMRGLYSCVLSKLIEDDAKYESAQAAFDVELGGCQTRFPDPKQVQELGTCVSDAAEAVAQKAVKPAGK